jgi:mannitol-specific phosphotransferase system IIBC component
VNTHIFTPKAKSLSAFVPIAAVLVLSAMAATPLLSAMPTAYASGYDDDKCKKDDKKKDDKKCKDDKDKDKDKKEFKCKHNGKIIRVSEQGAKNGHEKHGDKCWEVKKY